MKITFVGHAGLFIETRHGSILTDPWFNPAFFASWFPFPSNEGIDPALIANPDYLFVSHVHHDHFDAAFLREHVSKATTVLLPDFPINTLERELRALGFSNFIYTKNAQPIHVNGLRLAIMASVAPTDGPLGDSGLIVDDGEVCLYDQNDSRPVDLDRLVELGPFDAHFLQFSGAIWYPMVYQYPEKLMRAYGRKKRENELARALRYAQQLGAAHIIPHAGPPCFLDDDLWAFNDLDRDPVNTFPDQTVFLEYLQAHDQPGGHLMIPGSVMRLTKEGATVAHPMPEDEVRAIFSDKRAYLEAYKARKQRVIDAEKAAWPRGQVDIAAALTDWFEPLMAIGDVTCVGINGRVLMEMGETKLVLDFQNRRVYPWAGEEWEYRFAFDPALIEWCIVHHVEDWINDLFLSCRFEAERKGAYNEYIYNFFKCLSPERLEYAEGYYAERSTDQQFIELEGYKVQRRCPHLKADLARFGKVEDGVLTCTMHGWQFELATGRCLTSDDRKLYSVPLTKDEKDEEGMPAASGTNDAAEAPAYITPPAIRCKHCWYVPGRDLNRTKA